MAPDVKKRRRHGAPFESSKKQKFAGHPHAIVESLPWHEVPFPTNFQDAEGFFGLEELSDVEIVRGDGKIEYKVRLL